MQIKLFSIYDSKAGIYQNPWQSRTKGEAIRGFTTIANDKTHPIGKHPEDYILFEIGTFEDTTCEINLIHKESCGVAIEYLTDEHRVLPPIASNNGTETAKKK